MNIKLGSKISELRKCAGLTQEQLAQALGVTNQSVSKWESDKCYPDIELLPRLCKIFGCSMDYLFGLQHQISISTGAFCPPLPWNDDDVIRGVVYLGRKILTVNDNLIDKFTFNYEGDAKSVKTHCNLNVSGNVSGGCTGENVNAEGNISGACLAGNDIAVGGKVDGDINCGNNLCVGGSVSGNIGCGNNIDIGGDVRGNLGCGNSISVDGDVTAEKIDGNVCCNVLKCSNISGKIQIDNQDQ